MRRLSDLLLVCVVAGALVAMVGPALGARADDAPGPLASSITSPAAADAVAVRVDPPAQHTTTTTTPTTTPAGTADGSGSCPQIGHAAVIDRANQRGWLCTDGVAAAKFAITTAISEPKPGMYRVYAKDRTTTSTFGGHFSYLDNFVAFANGTNTGARIAFHAVPRRGDGSPFQPYDTVGTPAWFGQSSGCIRVLPAQSTLIWDHLGTGDQVVVIS